jgi:thymidine kinase
MAKLYFYYASMNAGKSTNLLQADFNYRERGMETMLFTAAVHDRSGFGVIDSRIGLMASAYAYRATRFAGGGERAARAPARLRACGRAQFLTAPRSSSSPRSPTISASRPRLRACARTFRAVVRGSGALAALADTLVELKAVCECGRKATMNLRVDALGGR